MTVQNWLDQASAQLKLIDIDSADLDAKLILGHCLGEDKTFLISHSDDRLEQNIIESAGKLLEQRKKHVPIAYITNHIEFYGLDFYVDQSVLVPRPETEALVHAASDLPAKSALDVGTGSGAIAIALTKTAPKLEITATDISDKALAVARKNANKHGCKIKFKNADLFTDGKYDLVTANLPYVPDGQAIGQAVHHEPKVALYSGIDGLDLMRKFIDQLSNHLNQDGHALIEHLPDQLDEICKIASKNNFRVKNVSDYVSLLF